MARRLRKPSRVKGIVMICGHFNPIHIGHLNLIEDSQKLGHYLIAVVCNDAQARLKRDKVFMSAEDRVRIIRSLKGVDEVILAEEKTSHLNETLKKFGRMKTLYPKIFANGCDEDHPDLIKEMEICKEWGIQVAQKVGGRKVRNSSVILKEYAS